MMKNWYKTLDVNRRIVFWTIVSSACISVLLLPLCFFSNYDILLGFILGVVISIINYILIVKQSEVVVNERSKWIYVLFYLLRYGLYLLGLLLALLLKREGINIFNVFAVFGGYFPSKIIVIILGRR